MTDISDGILVSTEQLYSMSDIEQALEAIAIQIDKDIDGFIDTKVDDDSAESYDGQPPIVIGIMNGAVMTMGHLLPKLRSVVEVGYCHATRYHNTTTGGELHWLAKPQDNLAGRYIVLVDDIFDEGVTLKHIAAYCKEQGATVVKTAVLLDKQHNRKVEAFSMDYTALTVADRYVFGFGMDYQGIYRNLAGIYALPEG